MRCEHYVNYWAPVLFDIILTVLSTQRKPYHRALVIVSRHPIQTPINNVIQRLEKIALIYHDCHHGHSLFYILFIFAFGFQLMLY